MSRHPPVSEPRDFEPFRKRMASERLPPSAIASFRSSWERVVSGETGLLPESTLTPLESLPDSADLAVHARRGADALARTVVLKLNGGLGTSMGMTRAKSLLLVRQGATFLDLTARQVLALRREHRCGLPLLLMNSFRTRKDSLRALDAYPDLHEGLPADFLQNKVPKVLVDGLTPAEWPQDPELSWCPPGHGDIYTALVTSGMLDLLRERGIEYAFVSNADNLGAVPDLGILGWFASEGVSFLMEACDRTESDRKGGHLALRRDGGGLLLRDVAQCPPGDLDAFQDVARHRFFNTNNLWVSIPRLAELLEAEGFLELPLIRNEKTLDPTDETTPRVYQLETAMGAAISVFDEARAVRVPRERFLPVKTTSDLLGVRSDVFATSADHRILPVAGRRVGDLVVDLDPRFYKRVDQLEERFPHGPPSLADCRKLTVRGDVHFGAGVICRGDHVTVEQDGPEPRHVPDGRVLT